MRDHDLDPPWRLALEASFGSLAQWQADAQARARAPGVAWLVLAWSSPQARMLNLPLVDGAALPAGHTPLLSLRAPLAGQAFDWPDAYRGYQAAVHHDSLALSAGPDGVAAAATLLDVRRAGVFQKASTQLPGAQWRDPVHADQWAAELPAGRPVLVYCVYGHEVSRATALRLRAAGVDARFLEGGMDAWQAAGRPLQAREGA